ncbi:phytanoyl-CoA dioxygenase family protein [Rhizodiscina lignyota]|uniref:Phytanoyl-CoA dioxygenase family protein n=1 Tax=Rhizodiscina lignyota TaxID=1504668 RepID=A0A9P4I7N0_9PEZI|nr:phytanoyl-CoA dioxygenase family protein [Rhizodiscina lignyota]
MTSESSTVNGTGHPGIRDLGEAYDEFKEQGWTVIPNVLDEDRTKEVLDHLWAAAGESERRGESTYMPRLDPNNSNVRVFYLMELDGIFRELISHPVAVDIVSRILGEEFLISNFTANIARPGSKSMGLHSDQSLQCPDPWTATWSLNCIWALHDVYKENGATMYIPGSHKWVTVADVPDDAEKMLRPFEAKAGSIIVMDGRLWHTSGSNVTKDRDRALLFGAYNAPWMRGQINWNAGLSEASKSQCSEQLKEWLGLNVKANSGKVKGVNRVYQKGVAY